METLTAKIHNIAAERKSLTDYFKKEKADGIKKAWYYWHQAAGQLMALDTKDMYNEMVELYKSQGILQYKTIVKDGELGCKKANMIVFRNVDETKRYEFEHLSLALGYMPADMEMIILEVTHVLPTPSTKKKKRK